jgi:ParB family transcriptional regulator, chromosome partitioning protein
MVINTMIDLSSLDAIKTTPGQPLMINIEKIIEDPNQPRQEFPEKELLELAEDIKDRGIKNPVSVKPINDEGFYILNAGARRLRASLMAGLSQIPVFIDNDFTDYDQVNENEQRQNLSPMELALFIKKRLDAGDKEADIARKLRRDKAYITHHKALIDLPDSLNELYRSGRCKSAYHLYELRKSYGKSPQTVDAWCATDIEISRKSISDLDDKVTGNSPKAETNADIINNLAEPPSSRAESGQKSISQKAEENNTPLPHRIRKPVLSVKHRHKSAIILLDRRPEKQNHIFIRYEGDIMEPQEVPCEAIKIVNIADAC